MQTSVALDEDLLYSKIKGNSINVMKTVLVWRKKIILAQMLIQL
jgi:hypothetical protein